MNTIQLNNALLEILLHIGNSFDIKKVANEALISYLQQLNLTGIVLYEKQRVEYTIHTVKPKNIKSNRVIIELFDDMVLNIKDIQKECFDKDMPYVKIKNQNFYYIYELKGFGLLMFIKNSDALENYIHKALRQLNFKFATSLVACNNLSELRKQEEQLIQQTRLAQMGEMISMIAHQWRQPLGAISATSINLQLKLELEEFDLEKEQERETFLNYLNKSLGNVDGFVESLTTTIDDFRNFYKPNKQAVKIKLEELISKSLSIINSSLINDNIKILQDFNPKEEIELYDSEMMQVILNILKNAQDNFKEKDIKEPYIKITTKNKTISISDNAGGISEDIIGKIFDPYFSTKDEKNGTGLGLYMSKIIIEEHHKGKLLVSNRDGGACFKIELDS